LGKRGVIAGHLNDKEITMKTARMYHCSRIPQLQRQSLLATAIVLAVVICSLPAFADGCIPYCNVGTIAPTNIFTATSTGDINGYFVSKGTAIDEDFVRMLDITTGTVGPWVFDNQTTMIGTMADFGAANAGDTLVFELQNTDFGDFIFASDPSLSEDGENHAYATTFSGGIIGGFDFPAGTYVGMEDLPNGQTDWNYNDDSFIVVGVSAATATPEPSSILLFGSGILGLAGVLRRKLNP
jgi:PEP-CTERM motif